MTYLRPLLLLILGLALGASLSAALAWVDPTAAPPAGNAPAPINVSSVTQTKTGGLNIATVSGNVGIGTTNPGVKLDVAGTVTASDYVHSTIANFGRASRVNAVCGTDGCTATAACPAGKLAFMVAYRTGSSNCTGGESTIRQFHAYTCSGVLSATEMFFSLPSSGCAAPSVTDPAGGGAGACVVAVCL